MNEAQAQVQPRDQEACIPPIAGEGTEAPHRVRNEHEAAVPPRQEHEQVEKGDQYLDRKPRRFNRMTKSSTG